VPETRKASIVYSTNEGKCEDNGKRAWYRGKDRATNGSVLNQKEKGKGQNYGRKSQGI